MNPAPVRVPRWPEGRRYIGLAHGWEGGAWVTLQLILGAGVEVRPGLLPKLERHLRDAASGGSGRFATLPGQFLGRGGAGTLAVLATRIEPRFADLAQTLVRRWTLSSCETGHEDLMSGHAGALLAMIELMDLVPSWSPPPVFVATCYRRTLSALRRMSISRQPTYLGFAHGVAGLLLAAEASAARLGQKRDGSLMDRAFDLLASQRMRAPGRGAVWAPTTDQNVDAVRNAWCHGSPGIVLGLHSCFHLTGRRHYRDLSREAVAAIVAFDTTISTFCCGSAGRAQVLLELYRQSRDARWLAQARAVAPDPSKPLCVNRTQRAGFLQGTLGVKYLEWRLAFPHELPLPGTGFALKA